MACRVGDIVAMVEELAPPNLAEEWDNSGLQVGSLQSEVAAVLVSIDVTGEVMAEARETGAGLLVCHHPPLFAPLHSLNTDEPPGSLLREAILAGVAIYAAHTNLDNSPIGVSAVLAELFGLRDARSLREAPAAEGFKLVTFLPPQDVEALSASLFEAGAGVIGDYSGCSFRVEGTGTFTPGPGARPSYGQVGQANQVREVRLEVPVAKEVLRDTLRALLANHPYEEPAYDVYPLSMPASTGTGMVGDLPEPMELASLVRACSRLLGNPAVRLAGDPGCMVQRVAVCGGSGGDLASRALEAQAEVLITGDVSHHRAMDAVSRGLAIIDAGHYHTERPVITRLASLVAEKAAGAGLDVDIRASDIHTCPWRNGGEW